MADFTDVASATLHYGSNSMDITDVMDKDDSSFTIHLNEGMLSSIGDLQCEIVLKNSEGVNILTTNTFTVRIKGLEGGCNC